MGLSVMAESSFAKPVMTDAGLVGERQGPAADRPAARRDVVREGVRNLHLGLEGAGEEAAFDRLLDRRRGGR